MEVESKVHISGEEIKQEFVISKQQNRTPSCFFEKWMITMITLWISQTVALSNVWEQTKMIET